MKNIIIFPLIVATFFTSCTELIEIKTDNSEPVIVINGILTDEHKYQEIHISRSSPYFDDEPNAGISNALVTVESSNNEVYKFMECDTLPGIYYSQEMWAVKENFEYHLNVKVDFDNNGEDKLYQASTKILPPLYLDSAKIVPMDIMGHANYALNVYGQDPPSEDYYLFKLSVNDSLVTSKLSQYIISDDVMINNGYIPGLTIEYFGDISEWEKDTEETRRRSLYAKEGDKIGIELSMISKGYFDFISQCVREMRGENPMFGGPASNITTNISNGGVGYFSGYCITHSTTEVGVTETE